MNNFKNEKKKLPYEQKKNSEYQNKINNDNIIKNDKIYLDNYNKYINNNYLNNQLKCYMGNNMSNIDYNLNNNKNNLNEYYNVINNYNNINNHNNLNNYNNINNNNLNNYNNINNHNNLNNYNTNNINNNTSYCFNNMSNNVLYNYIDHDNNNFTKNNTNIRNYNNMNKNGSTFNLTIDYKKNNFNLKENLNNLYTNNNFNNENLYQMDSYTSLNKYYINNIKKRNIKMKNIEKGKMKNHTYCNYCNKFIHINKLKLHNERHHIKCSIDNCNEIYSIDNYKYHLLSHVKNKNNNIILEDPHEIKKWLEERKKNYPRKNKIIEKKTNIKKKPKCLIEKLIMENYYEATGIDLFKKKENKHFFFFPYFKYISEKHYFNDCSKSYKKKEFQNKHEKLLESLNIHKTPPLLYQIMQKDIYQYERKVIKCIEYITENNFFEEKNADIQNDIIELK